MWEPPANKQFHHGHLCMHCGYTLGQHGGAQNPLAPDHACPPEGRKEPKWPSTIKDEERAGKLFETRLRRYWSASRNTFEPIQ